jgi:hypothetical protein
MQQTNIFEALMPIFKFPKDKPIRLFESFAGVGMQRMALNRLKLPYVSVGISEIDKYALLAYKAVHGDCNNYGDICKMQTIPDCDIFTYSFPCFTGDTLVMTDNGSKRIDEVRSGDKVLTHKNRFMEVNSSANNGIKKIFKISAMSVDEIRTTENHKFYCREMYKVWNNERRSYDRLFHSPEWVETNNLTKKHYLGVAINEEKELPPYIGFVRERKDGRTYRKNHLLLDMQTKDFWWIIGRYIGDGWARTQEGIIICDDKKSYHEITEVLDRLLWNYNVVFEKTVAKIHIPFYEIKSYVAQFGSGASNKHLTNDVLNLPCDLLESFLTGYISADGSKVGNVIKASSVSKRLIYDIAQCIAKVYKTPYRIYSQQRKPHTIEGREITQRIIYTVVFKKEKKKQDHAFYENGYIWLPIRSIEEQGNEVVYDIEVEEDHSFMANGIIAHNCTDLSKAGKQAGLSGGTRSGLVYEVIRLLKATTNKPKAVVSDSQLYKQAGNGIVVDVFMAVLRPLF